MKKGPRDAACKSDPEIDTFTEAVDKILAAALQEQHESEGHLPSQILLFAKFCL